MTPEEKKAALLKEIKEEAKKASEEGAKGVIDEALKGIEERVEKIEALPLDKLEVPTGHVGEEEYRGYNLKRIFDPYGADGQASAKAKKLHEFFGDDQKKIDACRVFTVDFLRALKKGAPVEFGEAMEEGKNERAFTFNESLAGEGLDWVPVEWHNALMHFSREVSFALKLATVIPMKRKVLDVPKEKTGPTMTWISTEGGSKTQTDATVGKCTLQAYPLAAYVITTEEFWEDSAIDPGPWLMDLVGEATGQEIDNQVLNGTGTPGLGILHTDCAENDSTQAVGENSFKDIHADDLSYMMSLIPKIRRTNAAFYMHREVLHYLRTLKDNNNAYIYAKPGEVPMHAWSAFAGMKVPTVWEYPVVESEQAPDISNDDAAFTPFIGFGDLKYYLIGLRHGSLKLLVDPYTYSTTDKILLRFVQRIGIDCCLGNAFARHLTNAA